MKLSRTSNVKKIDDGKYKRAECRKSETETALHPVPGSAARTCPGSRRAERRPHVPRDPFGRWDKMEIERNRSRRRNLTTMKSGRPKNKEILHGDGVEARNCRGSCLSGSGCARESRPPSSNKDTREPAATEKPVLCTEEMAQLENRLRE